MDQRCSTCLSDPFFLQTCQLSSRQPWRFPGHLDCGSVLPPLWHAPECACNESSLCWHVASAPSVLGLTCRVDAGAFELMCPSPRNLKATSLLASLGHMPASALGCAGCPRRQRSAFGEGCAAHILCLHKDWLSAGPLCLATVAVIF